MNLFEHVTPALIYKLVHEYRNHPNCDPKKLKGFYTSVLIHFAAKGQA